MKLYKYYPDSLNSFRSLSINGLWCHYPKTMNDPFECLGYLERKLSKEQCEIFRNSVADSQKDDQRKMSLWDDGRIEKFVNSWRKELISRFAFCALSESFDDILMWSHYASSHTGFVIGFEIKDEEIDHNFQKVKYIDSLPDFDILQMVNFIKGDDSQATPYFLSDISTKSTVWDYEKEWRIWRSEPTYFRYKIENVISVYFGVNCKHETMKIILELLKGLPEGFLFSHMEFGDNPVRLKYE